MICLALHKIPETSAIGMLIALVGMVLVTRLGKHTKYRTHAFSYLCDLIPSQTGIATL